MSQDVHDPLVIVGLSCRFPGIAGSLDQYWQLLVNGEEATAPIPSSRMDISDYYADAATNVPGKMRTCQASLIQQDPQTLDAAFFNISPKEAKFLDPQQRLLLEVTWEALENAGIPANELKNSNTGVFIGISTHDYIDLMLQMSGTERYSAYTGTGNALSTASGRLSYWLGCEGPALSIDTSCSSSLVALHEAIQSIEAGDCEMAIVGAVSLLLSPEPFISFSQANMLARDGRSKTFDASADGYGRGEGCGVVIIKRLSQARANNDKIWAIIRGSAVNQDGHSSGLAAPHAPAQEKLIRRALKNAGLTPNDIDYIETHGTGTSLGDPVECAALKAVFATGERRENSLIITSAKTNIGHLEAAAGMAGLIKAVLSMQHQSIPALLHFQKLNPQIDLCDGQLLIPQTLMSWKPRKNQPRRAGVSAFGFSGTNAHVIIEEAINDHLQSKSNDINRAHLFLFSAKEAKALDILKQNYLTYLSETQEALSDIAYTSAVGRVHFPYRFVVIACTKEELMSALSESREVKSEDASLVALAERYLAGEMIDWKGYYENSATSYAKVSLPTYSFQRHKYWVKEASFATLHPLLGSPVFLPEEAVLYQQMLSDSRLQYLWHHVVLGTAIMPAAAMLEMFVAAGHATIKNQIKILQIKNIQILKTLILDKTLLLQTQIKIDKENKQYSAGIYSRDDSASPSILHANATIEMVEERTEIFKKQFDSAITERCDRVLTGTELYPLMLSFGFLFQYSFQVVDKIIYNNHEALVFLKDNQSRLSNYFLSPTLLDAALQGSVVMFGERMNAEIIYLPVEVGALSYVGDVGGLTSASHIHLQWERDESGAPFNLCISIYDVTGYCRCYLEKIRLQPAKPVQLKAYLKRLDQEEESSLTAYETFWQPSDVAFKKDTDQSVVLWVVLNEYVANAIKKHCEKGVIVLGDGRLQSFRSSRESRWKSFDTMESALNHALSAADAPEIIVMHEQLFFQKDVHLDPSRASQAQMKNLVDLMQLCLSSASVLKRLILWNQCLDLNELAQNGCDGFMRSLWSELALNGTQSCHMSMSMSESIDQQIIDILREIKATNIEREVRYSLGKRYVRRLKRLNLQESLIPQKKGPYTLMKGKSGVIEDLHLNEHPAVQRPLASHELRIKIKAAGLNFRDVLNAMNLYPGDPGPLGGDFAGIVIEVGDDLKNSHQIGDSVFGIGMGSLASEMILDGRLVVKQVKRLSHRESASLPTVFLTAYLALIYEAKLKLGEKILIHTASGGVGLAAIQIAQALGTEIYATAGSERKREYLKSLGIEHVYDSRSLEYASEILQATHGQGVDVVLNTLTGAGYVEASLRACAQSARFIEISKRDVWAVEQVKAYRNDITYSLFALDHLVALDPSYIKTQWQALLPLFEAGVYRAVPCEYFTLKEAKDAFRMLQRAEHIGKVVITLEPEYQEALPKAPGSFLVTGGLKGLGWEVAKNLVSQGVESLILVGRQAPTAEVQALIHDWQSQSVHVLVRLMDITQEQAIADLFNQLAKEGYALRGIVHAAGAIRDNFFEKQTWSEFETVLKPKLAAWYLHDYSLRQGWELEHFITFSSIASVLGSAGQTNYAAANSFMDGLVAYRRQQGLSGQSIHWGPWAEIGMVINNQLNKFLESSGFFPFATEKGIALFEQAMRFSVSSPMFVDADWDKVANANDVMSRFLEHILPVQTEGVNNQKRDAAAQFEHLLSLTPSSRQVAIEEKLKVIVAQVSERQVEDIDSSVYFEEMGFDSLMMMEMRNHIQQMMTEKVPLSTTLIYDCPTIKRLSLRLAEQMAEVFSEQALEVI